MRMKKFMFFAFTLVLGMAWSGANADGVWTYDESAPLVTDADQITTNSITDEGENDNLYDALYQIIDEDYSTYYHSCWFANSVYGLDYDVEFYPDDPSSELPYLQFDLLDDYDCLIIHLVARDNASAYNDCPAVVNLYGSGDAEEWTLVQVLNFAESGGYVTASDEFTSDVIQSDTPYQYWRFEVVETATNRTETSADGDETIITSLAELQFYEAIEVTDQSEILQMLVDSVEALGLTFTTGTDPGYYDADLVAAYEDAFAAAEEGVYEVLTDEEYIALGNALREALAAVLAGVIPLPDGFYYIVSPISFYEVSTDEDTYGDYISVTKAIYETDDALYWATLDSTDVNYMWTVTATDTTGYTIQNYGTGNYIYGTATNYVAIPTTSEPTTAYIQGIGNGMFAIYSDLAADSYHPQGHSSGEGESGSVVIWETTYSEDNSNVWYFEDITLSDDELAELTDQKAAENLLSELESLVSEANSLYTTVTTVTGDGLVIDVSQLSSNAQETSEGSLDVLLDGTTDGFFHSEWSDATTEDYHNLQVSLYEQVDEFILLMWARSDQSSSSEVDFPSVVRIYATNDADLGADATSDSEEWDEVYLLEIENPGIDLQGYQWQSDGAIEVGGPYQYFRFSVEETMSGRANEYSDAGQPFFTLSEFQMYTVGDDANAQYNYIEGMQEAVDAMMAAVATAEESIEAGETTQDEVDNLAALIEAVEALVVDVSAYTTAKNTANALLTNATIGEEPGCVSQDAYDALEAAVAEAAALVGDQPTSEDVAAAVELLEAAIEAFNDAIVGIDTDTWYYIIAASGSYEGQYLYAANEVVAEEVLRAGYTRVREVDTENDEDLADLRLQWRLIEATDSTYYLLNRLTGSGPTNVATYYNVLGGIDDGLVHDPEWVAEAQGDGTYEFISASNSSYYLYTYGDYGTVAWTTATDWALQAVDTDALDEFGYVTFPVLNNSVGIFTYASNIATQDGFTVMDVNPDIKTYAVKSMSSDGETTTVELTLQDEFAAGEPFVLMVGDYNNYAGYFYVDESDTITVYIPVPTEFTTTPGTANGLVGYFEREYDITKEGLGYITWDDDEITLGVIKDGDTIYVAPNTGYFVPVTEEGTGNTDAILTLEGGEVTGIQTITAETEEGTGNTDAIYDLQGRQVARAGKGIYIINGKKVIK